EARRQVLAITDNKAIKVRTLVGHAAAVMCPRQIKMDLGPGNPGAECFTGQQFQSCVDTLSSVPCRKVAFDGDCDSRHPVSFRLEIPQKFALKIPATCDIGRSRKQ